MKFPNCSTLPVFADHQVVHQRPRLRVEDALLFYLVVMRRFVIDFKQSTQRQHLAFAQQEDVIADRGSERDFLIVGDAERAVVLRQAFIEPDWGVWESVVRRAGECIRER